MHRGWRLDLLILTIWSVLALSLAGCTNHVKYTTSDNTSFDRDNVQQKFTLEIVQKDEAGGVVKYKVVEHRVDEVKVFENHNQLEQFTPYEGWREAYEIPLGILMLPFGVAYHLLSLITFGWLPASWLWEYDCICAAALNPWVNIESETRIGEEILDVKRTQVDSKTESITMLSVGIDVMMRSGDYKVICRTDDKGTVEFSLLDVMGNGPTLSSDERTVEFLIDGEDKSIADQWIVSRDLQERLRQGAALIRAYRGNETGAALENCAKQLENLKFYRVSYALEKSELARHSQEPGFVADFKKAGQTDTDKPLLGESLLLEPQL